MTRIKTCAVVSLLLLSILAPSLIKSTVATEAGDLWYTHWGDFQDYRSAPENVSTTTTVSDVTGIYQYKVALVVSAYQYEGFGDYDAVIFRVAVYIESSSTELPAYAWRVMIDIEKDTSGSDLNRQTMETVYSDVRPGFSQSYGLRQTTSTSSTYDNRAWWALKALAFAAGLYYQPIGVVTGLIDIAKAFLPAGGVDYRNAGPEDPEALIWWEDGFGGLGSNKQYCLNTILWMQDPGVNPSTYYGLKIWARVALAPQLVPGLPPDIDTPPVYMRIYHNDPPATPSTPSGSTSGYTYTAYPYSTSTTDPNGNDVCYEFDWGDGYTTTTPWKASGVTASASHSWSSLGTYDVTVRAQDSYNLWSDWSPPLTVNIVNRPPNTPSAPSGPTTVYRNVWYTYSTSTTDPDGNDVRYQFEFTGPGTNVSFTTAYWYASGETGSITVKWESSDPLGEYQIRVRAQDVHQQWSGWSQPLTVNLVNSPPNTPSTPSGPTLGYSGTSCTYSTSTTDPDGDKICYLFYWDDGSITATGHYASGATVSASHSWSSRGTYKVWVRAQDVYGGTSHWSQPLTVKIRNLVGWVSPTGHETPTDWSRPSNAYDYDQNTEAAIFVPGEWRFGLKWSSFIVLTIPEKTSNKLRYMVTASWGMTTIDVDVYKDGAWVDVYQGYFYGDISNKLWQERSFTEGQVTKARVRFGHKGIITSEVAMIWEFDFWAS